MEAMIQCPFCRAIHIVNVSFDGYMAWKMGASAQDAFPELSADEREMLISGICPDCWDETFEDYEDEDEDALEI